MKSGEPGVAPQRPDCVAQILPQGLQRRQTARVTLRFFGLRHAAQPNQRPPPGLFARHARLHVFFRRQFHMRRQFRIEIRIQFPLAEERTHLLQRFPQAGFHRFSPAADIASTRLITSASRRQYAMSAASCLRPSLVIE